MEEVAEATGVRRWTAQWRLKMARSRLKKAEEGLSDDERRRLRGVVVVAGGDRIDAPLGSADAAAPPGAAGRGAAGAQGFVVTGPQVAGVVAGVFVVGAVAGAGALYALLSRDGERGEEPAIVTEAPPGPSAAPEATRPQVPSAEGAPPGAPSARAESGAATSQARSAANAANVPGAPSEAEAALLDRARAALARSAAQALELSDQHAARFPRSNVAEREEIAVHALVLLGQPGAAEARARRLLRSSPSKRAAMEALLGRALF